ncbi:MAG TPA: hypothetical protein VFH70_02150 [Acidimicrobiales bacterium]|nr:hypothetical protein [Acidimicrobiales bacterium]
MVNALIWPGVANVSTNGAAAWIATWGHRHVPLWAIPGRPAAITDTAATFVLLPLITCIFATATVRRSQRNGALPPLLATPPRPGFLRHVPAAPHHRGLVIGAVTAISLSPVALVALLLIDPGGMSRTDFVVYKATLGVGLGLVVTPIAAVFAMADTGG